MIKGILLSVLLAPAVILPDSTSAVSLEEITVAATRVQADAPMTVSLLDADAIRSTATGTRELPFTMQLTPSVVAVSDNGLGIGTSYIRIRGTSDERINFTMDGVPLNNPEDQSVFWANMNSYSASVSSMQIQRGVGSSTNGSGAFGASVSMESDAPAIDRHLRLETSAGSFGTYAGTLKAGTGLIADHLTLDGRFSYTQTDGYIDRTGAKLGSYFAQAAWLAEDWVLKLKNFGGYEHTGQAWNGVPTEMVEAGNRTYNSLGISHDDNGQLYLRPTTDNYWQNITHLSMSGHVGELWDMNLTLSLNIESGYYEDLKDSVRMDKKFGLNQYAITAGTDRHKWIDNRQYGAFYTARRTSEHLELTAGGAAMLYDSDHWGDITWIQGQNIPASLRYYENDASKRDMNVFAKALVHLGNGLNLFADAQLRHVAYRLDGGNDKFLKGADGLYHAQPLDVDVRFNFFNPKAGVSYSSNIGDIYLSYSRGHREPTRNNYTDAGSTLVPKPETLDDFEAGWSLTGDFWHAGIGLYYMLYHDQLIPTGRLSDIGEALTENVPLSYRTGIELQAGIQPSDWLSWELCGAFSRNRIRDFTEYIDNWDGDPVTVHYDETCIALSPAATASSLITLTPGKHLRIGLSTIYTGRQFLDNSWCMERSLDPYSVTDLDVAWSFRMPHVESAKVSLKAGNLFGAHYAPSGWVYTAVSESCGYLPDTRYVENGIFVQAPHTFTVTLSVDL